MAGISIDVSQLTALAMQQQRLSTARVGAKASQAVRKAAADVERGAKTLCPVDTGNLRNSISTTVTGSGNSGTMSAEIGPTANYGLFVEYGTSKMAPQAFMGPAFDAVVPTFSAAMEQLADGAAG